MSAEVTIGVGDGARLESHPLRATVLAEVHARPFTAIATPRRILHFAFATIDRGEPARAALVDFCQKRNLIPPKPGDRHHRVALGGILLRWEQHSEFTTYTWELAAEPLDAGPFHPPAATLAGPMGLLPQPGPILVAIDLHLVVAEGVAPERLFDRASLALAANTDGTALFATDFLPDPAGFVRILVADRGLSPDAAGAMVQRLLEVETYRTLALLGLPEAQRLAPSVGRIERSLAGVAAQMQTSEGLAANHRLLDELTALAAELEAGAVASLFRFGASRAYHELVTLRLQALGDRSAGPFPTWGSFLARRLAPAMRTCATMEERQANLSRKLAGSAQLLRTRVDVERERQNAELLTSMNERTRMQLRLQQTVEGLSVAAISYYLVGLIAYVAKGANEAGLPVDPTMATAVSVPLAVLAIWWLVRRIRRRSVEGG